MAPPLASYDLVCKKADGSLRKLLFLWSTTIMALHKPAPSKKLSIRDAGHRAKKSAGKKKKSALGIRR